MPEPLSFGIIGCGAVVERYHLPAFKYVEGAEVKWLVDVDLAHAKETAERFKVPYHTNDYRDLFGKVDAVTVAVPNHLHAPITIDCLNNQLHVLCEKPMATNTKDANDMIKASKANNKRLGIGMIRRCFDNFKMAKQIVNAEKLGKIKHFDYQEGWKFDWPARSGFFFKKKLAGGGVLVDWGVYAIDLISWIIGDKLCLEWYGDDSHGGIEADARIKLRVKKQDTSIPGTVELSRMRKLRNSLRIYGDKAALEVFLEQHREFLYFADQLRNFIDFTEENYVKPSEQLKVINFLEKCYQNKHTITRPWEPFHSRLPRESIGSKKITVLVTGATGFVGSRLVEILARLGYTVKSLVHNIHKAAAISRFPVQLVTGDLLDSDSLMDATDGCNVVIHCAYGSHGDDKLKWKVTVEGTRNLLEAIVANNCKKFIYFSTAALHGFKSSEGRIDEGSPYVESNDIYVKSKLKAEQLVLEYSQNHNLSTIILKPSLIYGPNSYWATSPVEQLKNRVAPIINGGTGLVNVVYIDDVIQAILLAIESHQAGVNSFFVSSPKRITWREYYQAYAKLVESTPNCSHDLGGILLQADRKVVNLPRLFSFLAKTINLLTSRQVRGIREEGRKTINRMPTIRATVKNMVSNNLVKRFLHLAILANNFSNERVVDTYTCNSLFSIDKIEEILGYEPTVSLEKGIQLTWEWLRYMRLV